MPPDVIRASHYVLGLPASPGFEPSIHALGVFAVPQGLFVHFELLPSIRFEHCVERVSRRDDGTWSVSVRHHDDRQTKVFDAVAVPVLHRLPRTVALKRIPLHVLTVLVCKALAAMGFHRFRPHLVLTSR